MEKYNLEVGQPLWTIYYWSGYPFPEREVEMKHIRKINRVTVSLTWYDDYKVRIEHIDTSHEKAWFTSKVLALEDGVRLVSGWRDKAVERGDDDVEDWCTEELRRLRKMIQRAIDNVGNGTEEKHG